MVEMTNIESANRGTPFVPGPIHSIFPHRNGILDGLQFAVKDLIEVAGTATGRGNPDFYRQTIAAETSAPCVDELLNAGATMYGKTITDEFAFSLEGSNRHYGTPLNPMCPDCLPGGSSSGSASAVAQDFTNFSLGTDTGGSIRVPAAFCGIYGLRPTHGLISLDGVMPFAPSYDCVGLLSKELSTLTLATEVLLPDSVQTNQTLDIACAKDSFDLVNPELVQTFLDFVHHIGPGKDLFLFENDHDEWLMTYRVLQGNEIRQNLGDDIQRNKYRFSDDIASRFSDCWSITSQQVEHYTQFRKKAVERIASILPENSAMLVPSAPCLPLRKNSSGNVIGEFYKRALTLNSIAGHAGLPQLCLPVGSVDGGPISMSLIGRKGDDFRLLNTGKMVMDAIARH